VATGADRYSGDVDQSVAAEILQTAYVGGRGWIGVELNRVSDKELDLHLRQAWRLIVPKKLQVVLE
jgi:hypothetical protein